MSEGMMIKKKLPNLLSLLESHTGTAAPEVPVVPKPPTPILLAWVQTEPTDKNEKRTKEGEMELLRGVKSWKKPLLSPLKWLK